MITFLITISFLIHAVNLFALIILFQRQNNMKQTEKKIQQTAEETEEMMSAFLMELKEENEQLIKQLSQKSTNRKEPVPPNLNDARSDEKRVLPPIVPRATAAKAYGNVKKEPKVPVKEQSRLEQMIELKKQGFSDEEIARELKIGITEVQLGLKFYRPQ